MTTATLDERHAMLRAGTVKRIHVDKHIIAQNRKRAPEDAEAVITIQTSRGPLKAHEVEVLGPSRFIYRPTKPLSCGARLWIETRAEVRIVPKELPYVCEFCEEPVECPDGFGHSCEDH